MNRYFYKTIQLIMISLISSVVIPVVVFLFILLKITLCLEIIHQITQIAFYVTTSLIAILTFRQAKKTIFSPMKKEMFKNQLDILKEHEGIFWKTHDPDSLVADLFLLKILKYNIQYFKDPQILTKKHGWKNFFPVSHDLYRNQFICDDLARSKIDFNVNTYFIEKWKNIYSLSHSPLMPESIQDSAKGFLRLINETMIEMQVFLFDHYHDILTENNLDSKYKEKILSKTKDKLYDSFMTLNKSIREYMMTDKIMN